METGQLILEIIRALAWPLFAFAVFFTLRRPGLKLLDLIETIRWEGVELDFRREFEQTGKGSKQKTTNDDRERARTEPRAMVLEGWIEVADIAMAALKKKGIRVSEKTKYSPKQLTKALLDAGIIDALQADTLVSLANIRNVAAHVRTFRLGEEQAIRYAHMARDLVEILKKKA